jgi:hypothetical protein
MQNAKISGNRLPCNIYKAGRPRSGRPSVSGVVKSLPENTTSLSVARCYEGSILPSLSPSLKSLTVFDSTSHVDYLSFYKNEFPLLEHLTIVFEHDTIVPTRLLNHPPSLTIHVRFRAPRETDDHSWGKCDFDYGITDCIN